MLSAISLGGADVYGNRCRHALHRQGHGVAARSAVERAHGDDSNWHALFIVASVMNADAALLAWFVLKPMRRNQIEAARAQNDVGVDGKRVANSTA
jgi:hypothetical protein